MTRSKQLVNLFHSAGHTLNYHDVLKIDTGLEEKSLESLDVNIGCFMPHNLKDKVFTHQNRVQGIESMAYTQHLFRHLLLY
jgi:hypothetical protein